jgi:phage terminase large subunit GpA-like protein
MPSEQITKIFSNSIRAGIPDGSLKISEWADRYRILPPERSTRPGLWSTDLVPYLREPMDVVTNPDVEEIVFMASSQVAKTEFLVNVAGYFIHIDPSPILFVAETDDKAQAWSKECFAPTVRVTPELKALVSEARARDSENTIFHKNFPGGHIGIVAATSPASLSSRPIRIVLLDECDAFKPTAEGDPVDLAAKRATTFTNRKIIKVSSPRDRDTSTIEPAYLAADRRKYFVPCPHCGEFQVLAWTEGRCSCPKENLTDKCSLRHGFVQWDDDPALAYYVCVRGCEITADLKRPMLAAGQWTAERQLRKKAGFWIDEVYSPFVTWGEMAENFLEKKKDPESLRVFVNTSLAETWDPFSGEIKTDDLTERQENYRRTIPDEILIIVAGVDTQRDRLELEIKGYGLDFENWGIDYLVLPGNPAQPQVWKDLETVLGSTYETSAGRTVKISAMAIDSGDGVHTKDVYKFARKHARRGVFAIKGANTPGKALISKPTKQGKPAVALYTIGTVSAKDSIAGRLEISAEDYKKPGGRAGFCHFPAHYPETYFQQLRSEKPITREWRGKNVRFWEKIKEGIRNEALDCFVYCEGAVNIYLTLRRLTLRTLDKKAATEREHLEKERLAEGLPPTETPTSEPEPRLQLDDDDEIPLKLRRRRRFVPRKKGNFVTG